MVSSARALALSLVLLTGCAIKFDPVEHARIVDIHHRILQAQTDNHCADPAQMRGTARALDSDSHWLVLYAAHHPKNDSMQTMAAEFAKGTADLAGRYDANKSAPSKVFCELRLKNLNTQIEVIQRTNARRPR